MSHKQTSRAASFGDDCFLWLSVRHFLSAGDLRELCAAVVDYGSESELTLEDLFDSVTTQGDDTLETWSLMAKPLDGDLARRLQDLVRAVAWQGDSTRSSDDNTSTTSYLERLRLLWWAIDAGRFDLSSIDDSPRRGEPPAPITLLFDAMRAVAQSDDVSNARDNSSALAELAERPFPLNAVLVKHIGDLCVDADDWVSASEIYSLAERLLLDGKGGDWKAFATTFRTVLNQSLANALWQLEGPQVALQVLSKSLERPFAENPLAYINGGIDHSSASWASRSDGMGQDRRAVVVTAPQLAPIQRHIGHGYEQLADGRYADAYRWFWAGLRRQTALGSHVLSAEAKGAFGRALIDQFADANAQLSTGADFWLGVRLIIESGKTKVAERARWSHDAVAKHVDEVLVARVLAHSKGPPSATHARSEVVLELFSQWTRLLPRDNLDTARAMLLPLVAFASPGSTKHGSEKNLVLKSQKALRAIAKEKPSFKSLVSQEIADLTLVRVREGANLFTTEMLSVALEYIDSLSTEPLRALVEGLLAHVESLDLAKTEPRYTSLVLAVLESGSIRRLRRSERHIADRIEKLELDIALGQQTEPRNLFFLLRRLPKNLVDENIDDEFIVQLVQRTRKRALQINSSDADENIVALLSAPEIAGHDGIRDALTAFRNILESALDDPAISFGPAYRVLSQLGNPREPISQQIAEQPSDIVAQIDEIWKLLLQVWKHAPDKPEIFNGFALPPPTEPNSVYVHNWTFASYQFAQRLSRTSALNDALDVASANAMLKSPIGIARSIVAIPTDVQSLDLNLISQENPDAFYAALGQRLKVLAGAASPERRVILAALLDGVILNGPNGMDAAVFTAALEHGVPASVTRDDLTGYGERLEADRSLRLGLSPLYYALAKLDDDDE